MKNIIKKILPYLAILHPSNWIDRRLQYPQLWYCMPFKGNSLGRKAIEKICGFLTGHEISKTEWGYGGGKFVTRNCRWCDKIILIPKEKEEVPYNLMDMSKELKKLGW